MELNLTPLKIPAFGERPVIIAGPCAAETEEQVMTTARILAAKGCHIFRAGIWKPRTKPGGFEGVGEIALDWLKHVKEETNLMVSTEVATPTHVELSLKYGVDILWIGARTTGNPFAVQEIADSLKGIDIPIFIKNPLNPDIELWIGALERFNNAGITQLGVIHRGFSSYGKQFYRNDPIWQIPIELHRRIPHLPIITDPSHIGGKRELIAQLSQQAMDLGFDGLIIESHYNPDLAWSDSSQQITPDDLGTIISKLIIRNEQITTDNILQKRKEIDEIDKQLIELLSKRMNISREIGNYKKHHNMTVRQADRYNEIMNNRVLLGENNGMSKNFISKIFENIHEESVRQQIEIINK